MAKLAQPATVLTVTDLTPGVRQLVVLPQVQKVDFQPGQWVSLKLPVGRPPLNRAYSISMAAPATVSGELTLVFDRVLDDMGSGYLSRVKAGDELLLSGPYGNFALPTPLDREVLFIARYPGLVPIRCIFKALYARREPASVLVIAVAPGETELLYHDELLSLAVTRLSFRYLPLVAATVDAGVELTLSRIRPLIEGKPHLTAMLCGTKIFVRPLRAFLVETGYDRKEVKTETYD